MAEDSGTPPPVSVDESADLSVAEFEQQFGDDGHPPEPDPNPEPDENPRRPPRDPAPRGDDGKFTKPPKHRAESQIASPRDVPRIAELTRRLRETEAERDALKAPPAVHATPPAAAGPLPSADVVPRGVSPPAANAAAEKPKLDSFQDYGDYVEALADWKIVEARRQDTETRTKEAATARLAAQWRDRVADAKTRHADFEAVALLAPTTIPQGSLVDAWILEHRSGADVLYSLQKDPNELRRILALPMFDQVEALTLLGQQRTGPVTREPAVRTGAAATVQPKVAPRPPTPVRTAAVPADDEPPDPESASLAEFERYYHRDR